MIEFCGLRSKCYNYLYNDTRNCEKCDDKGKCDCIDNNHTYRYKNEAKCKGI